MSLLYYGDLYVSLERYGSEVLAFKQILMVFDEVECFYRETDLLRRLSRSRQGRERFLQIQAYVVDDHGRMRGFLLPYGGIPLDQLSGIRAEYFVDVLKGALEIQHLGTASGSGSGEAMQHGDICGPNILFDQDTGRVGLIDVGNAGWSITEIGL